MDLERDPLALSKEAMREIGYRTVDLLVNQLTDPDIPAMRRGRGDELRARLLAPAPEEPRAWNELLAQLERDVLGPMSRLAHPGYFAFIPASSTFAGALGDLIAASLDIDVGSWVSAAEDTLAQLNAELVYRFEATGRGLLSSTKLNGRYAIRLCVMNHTSGPTDVDAALSWFATAPRPELSTPVPAPSYDGLAADVAGGWGDAGVFDHETIRRLPLFAGLNDAALDIVVKSAREHRAGPGESIVTRWEGTRHFYVVLSGDAAVRNDRQTLRTLGPGDYFGELAALDWGAGFGYARTAHVLATTPLRLLVLPASGLHELLRHAPEIDRRLRATARRRLTRM